MPKNDGSSFSEYMEIFERPRAGDEGVAARASGLAGRASVGLDRRPASESSYARLNSGEPTTPGKRMRGNRRSLRK